MKEWDLWVSRGEIRNDNIDLGIVNKVTEILGTDKIFRSRVWNKQKADPRQSLDKHPKSDRDTEFVKEAEAWLWK